MFWRTNRPGDLRESKSRKPRGKGDFVIKKFIRRSGRERERARKRDE